MAFVDDEFNYRYSVDAYKDEQRCIATAETLMTAFIEVQAMVGKVEGKRCIERIFTIVKQQSEQ